MSICQSSGVVAIAVASRPGKARMSATISQYIERDLAGRIGDGSRSAGTADAALAVATLRREPDTRARGDSALAGRWRIGST